MSESILLDRALCLPAPDIEALTEGRVIVAIPRVSIQKGWTFALCPCDNTISSLSVEKHYRSSFLSVAQSTLTHLKSSNITVKVWAKCEHFTIVHDFDKLEVLSRFTTWTKLALQETLQEKRRIFLACLRVYQLPNPIEVSADDVSFEKVGKFVGLPILGLPNNLTIPLKITDFLPTLSDTVFSQRKQQLIDLKPLLYSNLEELQSAIAPFIDTHPVTKELDNEIKALLGWKVDKVAKYVDQDLDWITKIAEVGNSSDGYAFEKLVRKSLIKLGFSNSLNNSKASLDPEATGGAGGIDVYCNAPFSLVGECKASKNQSVPTDVCSQLTYLGQTHLSKEEYDQSVKVIFAAGGLTNPANNVAIGNKMNVIRPETLQRLVELKAKYSGSIDLLTLEPCLRESPFGEDSDAKVNRYIDKIWKDIKLRSELVKAVKQLTQPDKKQLEVTQICSCYNFAFLGLQNQSAWLDNQTVYEFLIELSSPLVGYLGRVQVGGLSSDRFYYLRDLPIEE